MSGPSLDIDQLIETAEEPWTFVPNHLTLGLVASGISLGAGVVSLVFGVYAIKQFSQVRAEEIMVLIKGP